MFQLFDILHDVNSKLNLANFHTITIDDKHLATYFSAPLTLLPARAPMIYLPESFSTFLDESLTPPTTLGGIAD